MFHKNRRYRRSVRKAAINRKLHIIDYRYGELGASYYYQPVQSGKLAKGKLHCSCPLCAAKSTKRWGIPDNSKANYKHSDRVKFDRLDYSLAEYEETGVA